MALLIASGSGKSLTAAASWAWPGLRYPGRRPRLPVPVEPMRALRDVGLDVAAGERVGLVGRPAR